MAAKRGILVCGHGSRNEDAVREFEALAATVRARFDGELVAHGYLEFARPVLAEALDELREGGATDILAVPGMLFAAGHVKNDLPSVLNSYAARHPGLRVRFGRELGIDLKMLRAAAERVESALPTDDISRHETLLMVVGRGSSDPDANSNVSKVARMLWEGLGFGWAEVCYSGVTFPLVEPALEHAALLGYRRIVVFPYFLFTGRLVRRIYGYTDRVAARHPGIDFVKAPYLGHHPLLIETFLDRLREIAEGANAMNCQLCKYREQFLGFEDEVGLRQESHHHHFEGIGTGSGNGGGHHHHHGGLDHDHAHTHAHGHHHPYPRADHPLGPLSMKGKPIPE